MEVFRKPSSHQRIYHSSRWQRGTILSRTSQWSGTCPGPEGRLTTSACNSLASPGHVVPYQRAQKLKSWKYLVNSIMTSILCTPKVHGDVVSGMAGSPSSRDITRNQSPFPALLSCVLAPPHSPRLQSLPPSRQSQQKEHMDRFGSCVCPRISSMAGGGGGTWTLSATPKAGVSRPQRYCMDRSNTHPSVVCLEFVPS